MPADKNFNYSANLESPAQSGQAITTSNATDGTGDFNFVSRAIYVGGAGNVVVIMNDNTSLTFNSVPAGSFLPVRAKRIATTGTTATNMLALW